MLQHRPASCSVCYAHHTEAHVSHHPETDRSTGDRSTPVFASGVQCTPYCHVQFKNVRGGMPFPRQRVTACATLWRSLHAYDGCAAEGMPPTALIAHQVANVDAIVGCALHTTPKPTYRTTQKPTDQREIQRSRGSLFWCALHTLLSRPIAKMCEAACRSRASG